MIDPRETALSDDLETRAMAQRIQARLFDVEAGPVRVGRFELLRVLGAGGMGVVHLGHDQTLDRHVAIKLIRSERTASDVARERLLREARAMARLSHPNVVHVYEAGEHDGRVFIVMELVEGRTLREWIDHDAKGLAWSERAELLRAAGRGLAAAHRAGVVHRDFKPENVLLDGDGAVKVGDFGLAGLAASGLVTVDYDHAAPALTQTGAVIGTPAYMAPEQHESRVADERSDQFSFCVVAYEALVGQRPFEGDDLITLGDNVIAGRVRPIPSGCPVPRWLLAVITRGLEVDPARRWPSMDALLQAMAPRRRRSTPLLLAAFGLAGLGLSLGLAGVRWDQADAPPPASSCERGRSELADAWGPERRAALHQALRGSGLPYAEDTYERVAAGMDAYARDWADGFYEACREAADGPPSPRMACLERAREQLRLVTDELLAAQSDAVRHASDLVLSLPPLERCDDPSTAAVAEAPIDDPEVRALLEQLAHATVLVESWRFGAAEPQLERLASEAEALRRDPIVARVALLRARVALGVGQVDQAHARAREALERAERAEVDELELLAWASLSTASRHGGELERAAFELERAEALADRPTITAAQRATLDFDRASLLRLEHRLEEAVGAYEKARTAFATLSPEHPQIARILADMALVLLNVGRQDDAIAASEAALALQTKRLGPRHPALVQALSGLADQYSAAARVEEALELRRRALALLDEQADANPVHQVTLAAIIAGDLVGLRRFDEAEQALGEATRRATERLGPDHPSLGPLANSHGNLELERRRYAQAVPHYERALALAPAGDVLNRSVFVVNLALALARSDQLDAAMGRADEARALVEALAPDSAPRVAFEVTLAEVDRLAGKHDRARAAFERALAQQDQVELGDDLRLLLRFGLARLQPDPARARAHASQAQALAEAMPGFEVERHEIAAFLAQLP